MKKIHTHFTILLSLIFYISANSQTITDLDNGTFVKGENATIVDSFLTVSGDDNFTGGYLLFDFTNSTINDQLSIIEDGNLTVSDGFLYWSGERIGKIDGTLNGQNGADLKILFSAETPVDNSSYETGDASDWTVNTAPNQMCDQSWAEGPLGGGSVDGTPTCDEGSSSGTFSVSAEAAYSGDYGLKLQVGGSVSTNCGTNHSPSVVSNTFSGNIGDELSLWYNAARTSDYSDVFGFIFSDTNANGVWDDGESLQKLFHNTVSTTGGWVNLNTTLSVSGTDLRFWFLNGTYDNTCGRAVGSYLYIDDIVLQVYDPTAVTTGQVATNAIVEYIAEHIAFKNECGTDFSDRNFTIEVNDGTGSGSASALISIVSAEPAAAICQDITVYLDNSGNATIAEDEVDNGSTGACLTYDTDITSFDCDSIGDPVVVTLTVTDIDGNDSTCTANVTVLDNLGPVLSCKNIVKSLDETGSEITIDSSMVLNSFSDACGVDYVTLSQSVFDCSDAGNNTVTITAYDIYGNSSTCNSNVNIQDNTSPTAICKDITVQLDLDGNATIAEDSIDNGSTDNCSNLSFDTDVTSFTLSDVGNNVLTLTVTDAGGNSSQCTANAFVTDAPEVVTNPIKIVLWETGEYVLDDSDLKVLAEGSQDNNTPFEELTITAFPRTFECIHVGDSVDVKITVADTSGNSSSAWTKIMVYDETAPEAKCEDIEIVLDNNGEAKIWPGMINAGYTGGSGPEWVRVQNNLNEGSYDACGIENATLDKYVFDCADIGENVVTLTVTDPSDNSSSCEAVVTVVDTLPPQIAPVDDITIELPAGTCEAEIDYPQLTASDNCDVVWEQTGGLGADTLFPVGTTTETWTATDAGGNSVEVSFTVTVTTGNAQPTLDAIEDVVSEEDSEPITVLLTGIGYGIDCEPQGVIVTATGDNPELLTVTLNYTDGETGSLELSIAPEMSGTAEIEVKVEDDQGGIITDTFSITVNAVNDAPFLLNPLEDQVVNASYVLKVPISQTLGDVFDDVDDEQLNFSVKQENGEALPEWASLSGDTLTAAPLIADTGCVNIVITATDAEGASASDTFNVCVDGYPVSAQNIENTIEVQVYPNPTKGDVTLNVNTAQYNEMEVLVTSITGREVFRESYQGRKKIEIDLSENVAGIYMVILNVDGNHHMKKIILDK